MQWIYIAILLIVLVVAWVVVIRYTRLLLIKDEYDEHHQSQFSHVKVDEIELAKGGSRLRVKNLVKHPRSKSEAEVIRFLEEITRHRFPTVYPKWLVWKGHTLELDGYNESLKLALEFSGPLHTKWAPEFEPYINYFERITRDVVKRRLCRKHGVHLIVVDASLPRQHWRSYIESRLHDIGLLEAVPAAYIGEQKAVPYRNEQIERELGVVEEYRIACKL